MAARNEAKVRFSADTKNFNTEIKNANKELSGLRAELKLNEAQMRANGVSVEGLQEKQKNLTAQMGAVQDKAKALSDKLAVAVEIFGENSDEAARLKNQLLQVQTQEANLKSALDSCNAELERQEAAANRVKTAGETLTDTISDQEKEVKKLKDRYVDAVLQFGENSDEARDLANQIDSLSGELRDNKKALENAEKAADDLDKSLDDVGDEADEASDKFTILDGAIATFAGNALSSLVGGLGDAISTLGDLSQETQEYREDINKLETAFDVAGHTTQEATKVYKDLYSVFGEEDRAVEAAQQIAKLAENEEDMITMTRIATGAWAMWGDSLATESLMEAANSTAKIGEVQGTLADALEWCGINLDDFNDELSTMKTEGERSAHIMETLNGLYGDAADKYKETNESIIDARRATSDYTDAVADLGEEMEPLNTDITRLKTGFVRELMPALKNDVIPAFGDFVDELEDTGALKDISRMIGDLARTILPPLASVLGFVAENWKVLAIGIGTAVVAFKTMSIVNTVSTALQGTTGAMAALNAVMAANPVGAVVTALAALVGVVGLFADSMNNAKTNLDYVSEALNENITVNQKWQETMDNAKIELGDWSNFANAAGETTGSLKTKMDEAQTKITEIWANAHNENRALRDEEIQSIKEYNQQYIQAQNELVLLEQQKLQAQTDALRWKLDNMQLSAEEEQGILNTLSELRGQYNSTMGEYIAAELVLLEQRHSNGQISDQEYLRLKSETLAKQKEYANEEKQITQEVVDATLAAQQQRFEIDTTDYTNRVHHFTTQEEINRHYAEQIKRINEDENLSWWDALWAREAVYSKMKEDTFNFVTGQEVTWTDYNFLTDREIQKNQQAFFNWIANNKANGKTLDEDSKKNAKAILDAYADLPEDLEESGLNSLRGLAAGMADEYPELERAAEMDMDDLIEAMNDALGVHSPSTLMKTAGGYVMDGLKNGMNGKLPDIRKVVTNIGNSLINGFTKMFKIKSPSRVAQGWGEFIVEGLTNGIDDNTGMAVDAVTGQVDAIKDAYNFDGIAKPFSDLGKLGDSEAVITAQTQTNVSGAIEQTVRNSGLMHLAQAIEDLASRPIAMNINGREFALATASDSDVVNGNRIVLSNRGLAL